MRIIQNLKFILAVPAIVMATIASYGLGVASPVYAQSAKEQVCRGVNGGAGSCDSDGSEISKVIKLVVQILSLVAGVAAVIMIIVAGIRYTTSAGDATKIAGAKSAIIYAIVGLVVVVLAQFVVRFVLSKTTQ